MFHAPRTLSITLIAAAALILGLGVQASADTAIKATISDHDRATFATVTDYPVADKYVRMLRRTGGSNQQWTLTERRQGIWQVRSVAFGMCLSGHPDGPALGGPVTVEPCAWSPAQLWTISRFSIDGTVTVSNLATGLCLTQPKPTVADRRLREARCDNSLLQRFRINRL